jgi:alanine-synthesizing transaminase
LRASTDLIVYRRRDLRQGALRWCVKHTSLASLSDDVLLTISFNGLSKNYRSCGYRAGWMVVSGEKKPCARLHRRPQHAGLDAPVCQRARRNTASRRRSAATRASTTWWHPAGRHVQASAIVAHGTDADGDLPGVSCVKPQATLYMFPRLDPKMYPISRRPAIHCRSCWLAEKVLLVQGTGFNWPRSRSRSASCFCRMKMT